MVSQSMIGDRDHLWSKERVLPCLVIASGKSSASRVRLTHWATVYVSDFSTSDNDLFKNTPFVHCSPDRMCMPGYLMTTPLVAFFPMLTPYARNA